MAVIHWLLTRDRAPDPDPRHARLLRAAPPASGRPGDIQVTWLGHSTLLIQMGGLNILTDPMLSERASPVSFAGPKRFFPPPPVSVADLPRIDIVLISHDHYDHLDIPTLKALGQDPSFIAPLRVGRFLAEHVGCHNVRELDWWQGVEVKGLRIDCTPARHFSGRGLFDRDARLWASFALRAGECKLFFGGDSGYGSHFREIGERLGPFHLAALPVGHYEPRWFMSPVHMDPFEAVQAFLDLRAGVFVPIHWGTFKLSDEALNEPPKLLYTEWERLLLAPDCLWLLKPGETRCLEDIIPIPPTECQRRPHVGEE